MVTRWFFVALVLAPAIAYAQADSQPYAGREARAIKALSAEQVEQYLRGDGMGFALAGELNHYPGPKHVLELADQLALTPEQSSETQRVFAGMNAAARDLGRQLVDRERALDALFGTGAADSSSLHALVAEIASLTGRLRFTHLVAHLEMKHVLTQHQITLYDRLRGYGGDMEHRHSGERH